MPPFLHVANGTATTDIIAAASIPGGLSIWADPLYEGPVPAGLSDGELLDVRARYLAGPDPSPVDEINDLRRWRSVIENDSSYDELVLWFEHDLFDQLNLIQILSWLRGHGHHTKPVSLICIGSFPGRPRFKGLGELTPEELTTLLPLRQPVTTQQYDVADRAWSAFREPTPEALQGLLQTDTTAMPFLAPALVRFLQEYPWVEDGLSRTERRLLELSAGVAVTTLRSLFPLMHDGEHAYYVTDLSLAALAEDLSRASPPLLTLTRPSNDSKPLQGSITITDAGQAVRGGTQDKVATCGIDRWLGGVHLQGSAPWRWDNTRRRMTRH
jgi:hypothetical protein